MTPFITQIANYIAANSGGLFTVGGNLNVGELPRGADGVYAISATAVEPDMYTPVEYFAIDFWVVNPSTPAAYDQLQVIYDLLHQAHHYTTTSYEVYFSHANGQVEDQDRDAVGRKLLRLGVTFIVRSLIS